MAQELARAPELVGGDFHDVLARNDGSLVIVIGDVEGKGVKAAGLTETVRSAVRALALRESSPATILTVVNELLLQGAAEQFVTALLITFDPARGRGLLSSAGHPPPLHLELEQARFLAVDPGLPLGVLATTYTERPFELGVGASLVLYTDGLIEARRQGELFGEVRLLAEARQLRACAPQELVTALLAGPRAFADGITDDVQVLALRFTPAAALHDGAEAETTLTASAAEG